MLHVHASNRVERLADALADILRTPPPSPFEEDVVVVHSKGLEQWLAMQLASRLGVCANVAFPFPHEVVGDWLQAALGPEAEPTTADTLQWSVLGALPGVLHDPAMAPVRAYLEAGPDVGRRQLALSRRVAGLFDRYAAYRPEWIREWAAGGGSGWEPVLWRALERPGADLGTLVRRFEEATPAAGSLPGRVCLFSVATLPPWFVQLIAAVARQTEVHLLVLSPSPGWWEAVRSGAPTPSDLHPLLTSMGTLAHDFQLAIERVPYTLHPRWSDPGANSALHALQSDLHRGSLPPVRRPWTPGSIQIHACHGPQRQVEVLRDALLAAFEEIPGLQPRDVLVMAPDVQTWAPLVEAVLSDAAGPVIPFRIADQGVRHQNPVAEVVLGALDVVRRRLSASSVLDLLDLEPVRKRFGLDASAMGTLRAWIDTTGIRWGADREHRAAVGQPADEGYTWRLGLDRILLGHALRTDAPLVLDTAPVGDVEGKDERAMLAGFTAFSEEILRLAHELGSPASLEAWQGRILRLLDALVAVDDDDAWQAQQVRDGVTALAEGAASAGFHAPLDPAAFAACLEGRFSVSEPGRGFLTGAVTVCQLVPMRSLPFRVVVLLGLDDQTFPRTANALGFDRMATDPRPGDRSAREDDRSLFLEAILSARDRLIVTYSGRGPRNDESRPPAVPVSELLDALDRTFVSHEGRASEAATVHHPLQAFDPRALRGEPPRSFDARQLGAAHAWHAGRHAPVTPPPFLSRALPPVDGPVHVDLDQLVRFLADPITWFVTRRLGLWEQEEEDPVADREPLDPPDGLEVWAIRDQLLCAALAGEPLDRGGPAWARMRAQAVLPLGTPGAVVYDRVAAEAVEIARAAAALRVGPRPSVRVDLELPSGRLTGGIDAMFAVGRVACQAGAIRSRHRLALWVRHLALQATGARAQSRLVGLGGHMGYGEVPGAAAELDGLVALFRAGQSAPIPFFPRPSEDWWLARDDAWRAARAAAFRDHELGHGALAVLGGRNPFVDDVSDLPFPPGLDAQALAERVWAPAHAAELP